MSNRPYKWTDEEYGHSYDDIINLPRPELKRHGPISIETRAAQFISCDPLSGYMDERTEQVEIADRLLESAEEEKRMLNMKLKLLTDTVTAAGKNGEKPTVTIRYFIHDKGMSRGRFEEITGTVRHIDTVNREIVFAGKEKLLDGTTIKLSNIVDIKGDLFKNIENEICLYS